MPVLMRENTMIGNLAIKPGERESVSVAGDGTKTVQDLLYELAQAIDISKVKDDSYVAVHQILQETINVSEIYHIDIICIYGSMIEIHATKHNSSYSTISDGLYVYELIISNGPEGKNLNHCQFTHISVASSGQTPTMTFSSSDSDVIPAGAELTLYY